MAKSEFELIDWIRRNSSKAGADVLTGIGDDMAVVRVGDEQLLVTTDILLEGVHFDLKTARLEQVGYKVMACSLSDCAAMASVPFIAVVAVALPNTMTMDQAQQLHQGLQQAAQAYHCPIVGGDTTSWDKPLAINVTMLARSLGTESVLRSGARPGDAILVTGELGGSLAGRHLSFEPRVEQARQLTQLADLHAMIDISDGLSIDLDHICTESGVCAIIDADAIPISPAARASADPIAAALHDGEDFELLFCTTPGDAEQLLKKWPRQSNVKLTRIGQITSASQPPNELTNRISIRYNDGRVEPCPIQGWEHFRDRPNT